MTCLEEPVYNATRRKSVFAEAYNPEDDEGTEESKVGHFRDFKIDVLESLIKRFKGLNRIFYKL